MKLFKKTDADNYKPPSKPIQLHLSDNQIKIIQALRKKSVKRNERIKSLQNQLAYIKGDKKPKKKFKIEQIVSPIESFNFPMPCKITKKAKEYLENLKTKKVKNLTFPTGLKEGGKIQCVTEDSKTSEIGKIVYVNRLNSKEISPHFFGFYLDLDSQTKNIVLYYKYPVTPFVLKSPLNSNQGGLTAKLRMMQNFRKGRKANV